MNLEYDDPEEIPKFKRKSWRSHLSIISGVLQTGYGFDSEHETFASVRLIASSEPPDRTNRKSLDLIVILDKSGSMKGSKLEMCKRTVEFLLTQLKDDDKFSLCTFDRNTNMHPLEHMTIQGKAKLLRSIRDLKAGSNTNISGALFSAIHEIQRVQENGSANELQSILLLTDGIATSGITLPGQLLSTFEGVLRACRSLSLFTFGYGNLQDGEMLRQLSDLGNGMYYYIENEDQIPQAFGSCLGGLLSVVAQKIKIEFMASNGTEILKICIPDFINTKSGELADNDVNSIQLGDIFSGEQRDILVKIRLPMISEDPLAEFWEVHSALVCTAQYDDILGISRIIQTEVMVRRCILEFEPSYNFEIIQSCNRVVTAQAIDDALAITRSNGQSGLAAARHTLRNAIAGIKASYCVLEHSAAHLTNARELVTDLEHCLKGLKSAKVYTTFGSKKMSCVAQAHWKQRSNFTSDKARTNPYATLMTKDISSRCSESVIRSDSRTSLSW